MNDIFFFKQLEDSETVVLYQLIDLNGKNSTAGLFVGQRMKDQEGSFFTHLVDQSLQRALLGYTGQIKHSHVMLDEI